MTNLTYIYCITTGDTARDFCGALIKHIHKVLCERDEKSADKDQWILTEALNSTRLSYGGTFRNVLLRKIDNEIVPIFSDILSYIDQSHNLDLLINGSSEKVKKLWLRIFANDDVMMFRFSTQGRGLQQNKTEHSEVPENYHCSFPFFWLVKPGIDAKLESGMPIFFAKL